MSLSTQNSHRSYPHSDCFHHRLVLPVLETYIHRLLWYVLIMYYYIWLLSINIMGFSCLFCVCVCVFPFLAALHSTWDLSPPWGIEPTPLAFEVQSLNHWTAREVPCVCLFIYLFIYLFIFFNGFIF